MNTRTLLGIRRWLSIVGILSIVSSFVVAIPTASAFAGKDVVPATYDKGAVAEFDAACDSGTITCVFEKESDDAVYKALLTKTSNRATTFTMFEQAFGVVSDTARSTFTDLEAGATYVPVAHTAFTLGWTKGSNNEGKIFDGAGLATRTQIALILSRLLGLEDADLSVLDKYTDTASIPDWEGAKQAWANVVEAGLMGVGTTVLNPNGGMLKLDLVLVVSRSSTYAEEKGVDVMEVSATHWGVDVAKLTDAIQNGENIDENGEVSAPVTGEEEGDVTPPAEDGGEEVTPPAGSTTTPAVPAGTVAVSIASTTPAKATVVADSTSGDGAQALVNFTALTFKTEAGKSATVTTLKLKRTGVSADADLSNVYLYDGLTRLAEVSNISSTVFTFTNSAGLFTVSGEKTVTVVADLANGVTSGKTIALGVDASTDVEVKDGGTVTGTFPLTGNEMSTAAVADLGRLTINAFTTYPATIDPGKTDFEVWRFALVGNDQNVLVTKLNLTLVGTVAASDITNVKLVNAGTTLGTVAAIDNTNVVSFDLSTLAGGGLKIDSGMTKTMEVHADIIGGTNRSFKFTIRKSSDVAVKDLNYNVWLKPNQTNTLAVIEPTTGNGTAINSGRLVVSRSADSTSSTTALNATGVTLAKFDFKATGEPVKVETIVVESVVSEDDQNLNNGKLFVDGVQVGSTVDFDSDATDDGNFTDATTDTVGGGGTDDDISISLGNTFIIPAGVTKTLTLVADTKDGDGNTLAANTTVRLSVGGIVATGQISLSTITVGTADGNTLTCRSGSMTTSKNLSMNDYSSTSPLGVAGSTNVKIGSFVVQAGAGEDVNVTQLVLKDSLTSGTTTITMADAFQNLRVMHGADQVGSTQTSLTDTAATTYTFSVSPALKITAGGQEIFDVYADVLSGVTGVGVAGDPTYLAVVNADNNGVVTLDSVSGTGVTTSSTADDTTDRTLQNLYLASAGTFTVTPDSATPAGILVQGDGVEREVARFTLKESTGAEGIKITNVVVTDTSSNSTAFQSVKLFIDGVQLGGSQNFNAATNGTTTFSGLSYVLPANTTKTLVVKATPVPYPNGTANVSHVFTLGAYVANSAGITAVGQFSNTATNAPSVAVTSSTHVWARTSLTADGGVLTGHCTSPCTRNSSDEVLSLGFTSGSAFNASLRGSVQANDEAILNWVGTGTIALNSTNFIDGSNSVQVTSAVTQVPSLYYGFGTTTSLATFSRASFWLRPSANGTSTFVFRACEYHPANVGTSSCAFLALNSGAVLPASQWQYFTVNLAGLSAALTANTNFIGVTENATGISNFSIDNLRLYNDAITVDLSGSLAGTTTTNGLAVSLKDASNQIKAIGYAYASSPTATAVTPLTAVLLVGDDALNFSGSSSTSAHLDFSNVKSSFKVVTNTSTLMATDTTASESLTVGVALGSASAAGNIRWYDGAVTGTSPLTWVAGTTPIQGSYSY